VDELIASRRRRIAADRLRSRRGASCGARDERRGSSRHDGPNALRRGFTSLLHRAAVPLEGFRHLMRRPEPATALCLLHGEVVHPPRWRSSPTNTVAASRRSLGAPSTVDVGPRTARSKSRPGPFHGQLSSTSSQTPAAASWSVAVSSRSPSAKSGRIQRMGINSRQQSTQRSRCDDVLADAEVSLSAAAPSRSRLRADERLTVFDSPSW
jgi:hypothetical protein